MKVREWTGRARIRLTCGDCMDGLKAAGEDAWELAIVDPPYGILNIGMRITKPDRPNSYTAELKHGQKEWDSSRPTALYFEELRRVSKHKIIWGGNYFADALPTSGSWIYWDKMNGEGSHFADGELAYTDFTSAIKAFRVSTHHGTRGGKDRIHPTQKPVALYKWLLSNYAKKGDRILDTHGGSMSIALACWDAGHDLDAWEMDEDYFEAACDRIDRHVAQGQFDL